MKFSPQPCHVAVVFVGAGLGIALNLAIGPRRRAAQTKSCQSHLKIISLAMMQYVRDYDEHYPVAARWMDDLKPYGLSRYSKVSFDQLTHCPTSGDFYAFNGHLSQLSITGDGDSTTLVWFYDARNSRYNQFDQGQSWPDSPVHEFGPGRGNNVLFADGHVALTSTKPRFTPSPAKEPWFGVRP